MKELIKRSGLVFVVLGVLLLAYAEFSKMDNNTLLMVSGSMIMGGFIIYVILNNIME